MTHKMEDIRGAVARGWCADGNTHKEMDSTLAEAISQEVAKLMNVRDPMAHPLKTLAEAEAFDRNHHEFMGGDATCDDDVA